MKCVLIVAMDKARGIGRNNDLMWHLPNDMKFFKETTVGHAVVMGRKNFESIPEKYRPLANRENIILTRNKAFLAKNCSVLNSVQELVELKKQESDKTLFIIGGGEIYKLALNENLIDEMLITHVNDDYGADTFFPSFELCDWSVKTLLVQERDDRHKSSYSIVKYVHK
ncbi:dihydrofolate reductase [Crocinitomicaceae bacterium]|nr:dihydrofolate reductase [Crocinitomicaceae bacterium]